MSWRSSCLCVTGIFFCCSGVSVPRANTTSTSALRRSCEKASKEEKKKKEEEARFERRKRGRGRGRRRTTNDDLQLGQLLNLSHGQPGAVRGGGPPPQGDSHEDDNGRDRQGGESCAPPLWKKKNEQTFVYLVLWLHFEDRWNKANLIL